MDNISIGEHSTYESRNDDVLYFSLSFWGNSWKHFASFNDHLRKIWNGSTKTDRDK